MRRQKKRLLPLSKWESDQAKDLSKNILVVKYIKKMKMPIMAQQIGWECWYIYELGWHGRPESLTTSPSRDCLYIKFGVRKGTHVAYQGKDCYPLQSRQKDIP